MDKFNDFSALKALKKDLEEKEFSGKEGTPQPKKRSRTVVHKPKDQLEGEKVAKGVIIRHLILPGYVDNSLKVLDWIGETFAPGQVLVSLMRQYTPMPGMQPPLDRRITEEEYQAVLSWMYLNRLEGFTQEAESAQESFIPEFLPQGESSCPQQFSTVSTGLSTG